MGGLGKQGRNFALDQKINQGTSGIAVKTSQCPL